MLYKMTSQADEITVRLCYLLLFGREPESDLVVAEAIAKRRTILQIRNDTMNSGEYARILAKQAQAISIDKYLECMAERIADDYFLQWPSEDDVLILQTSDPDRYFELLNTSSRINKKYAYNNGMKHSSYVGIKRGAYAHHATYNRTHLLSELVNQNYTGWVFYIDADAIISKPNFNLKNHLSELRSNRKCMSLHSVHQNTDPRYKWWNVNAGCFAIDLASERARCVIRAWSGIYNYLFSIEDYKNSTGWNNIVIDDQSSLWAILKKFEMMKHVEITDIQGDNGYVKQYLRSGAVSISPDAEIEQRRMMMENDGYLIYQMETRHGEVA